MGEATGRGDRLPVGLPAGRHLEEEAMPLLEGDVGRVGEVSADIGAVHGLLAGDPAAPGHGPAGAVHLGAVQAGEGLEHVTIGRDPDRGGAAAGVVVVGLAGTERRGHRAVHLVVADQPHRAVAAAEGGHPVMAAGQQGAVVEGDRRRSGEHIGVVEGAVPEAGGQMEPHLAVAEVGHRSEGQGSGRGPGGTTDDRLQRATDEHSARRRDRGLQERPSAQLRRCHPSLLEWGPPRQSGAPRRG